MLMTSSVLSKSILGEAGVCPQTGNEQCGSGQSEHCATWLVGMQSHIFWEIKIVHAIKLHSALPHVITDF